MATKKQPPKKKAAPKKGAPPLLVLTEEFKEILDLLNNTKKNVFITGKAGTGKSTLLRHFTQNTDKNFVVLAPTGVAALNVGGQTIHSFFKFPPAFIHADSIKADPRNITLFKKLEMVIIDEVSMVRADLMQGIDTALRLNRNSKKPFGGVQMVFIGDLFQLPPVLRDEEIYAIVHNYGGQYFFDAKVFKELKYYFAELTNVFRQSPEQQQFIGLLNNIRNNQVKAKDMALLNTRHTGHGKDSGNSIFLTTHRETARELNITKLARLPGELKSYTAGMTGEYATFLDMDLDDNQLNDKFPAPYKLQLKVGAQIMMIKNDANRQWVNGSIGEIVRLEKNMIVVDIDGKEYEVGKETWQEIEYHYNSNASAIEQRVKSTFRQFPVQLSWAMTIHKSQGKTFDKITIDTGTGAFAHGQIYVALSRCTTLEGITLNNSIKESDIIVDNRVALFYNTRTIPPPAPIAPRPKLEVPPEIIAAIRVAVKKDCAVKIIYKNSDGINSERQLSQLSFSEDYMRYGYENQHITAFCHMRRMVRTFNLARIQKVTIVA